MRIDKEAVGNIVVLRNDRFGEFLLNIPALRALKETFTNARLTVVADPYVKDLAKRVPYIDEIIEWGRGRHALSAVLGLIGALRKKRIDIAIMLNPDRDFNIITYLSGIPVRAGYDRKWGFLLTHKMKDAKHLGERHEVEYNLELVSLLGAHTEDRRVSLSISESYGAGPSGSIPFKEGDKLVAIHPWTSDPVKQWPVENFRELSLRLSELPGIKVVIVGRKEGPERKTGLFFEGGEGVIDLAGKTTLIELAGLLKNCALIISGDSGPVHLASAVGTRTLALFRNDISAKGPRRWGPWGEGHIVIEKNKLADITVEKVLEKAKEALNN